jgi:DNA-binding NarL/FixJ family response regulator
MDTRGPSSLIAPAGRIAAARLAIIEGNHLKAELLHHYCAHHWGFEVVAVERSADGGVGAVKRTQPDLIIASVAPLETDAGEFIGQLLRSAPAAKLILLLSVCSDYLVHLIDAMDYHGLVYEVDEGLETLAQTIERVRQGIRTVSARIIRRQISLRSGPNAFPKLLSRREQEIMVCIAHSMSDEEIAQQFGLSVSTSQFHRKRIMGKLGIHSTPKLIQYSLKKGFGSVLPPASQRPKKVA